MDPITVLPRTLLSVTGPVSTSFSNLGILHFRNAAAYVRDLPYGFNETQNDILIALKDGFGTCVSKHALIGALAREIGLPVYKTVGLYPLDESVTEGVGGLLKKLHLPFVPAIHCFLSYGKYRIDLTEGNCNGKKRQIEEFFFTRIVTPLMKEEEEARLYDRWCESLLADGGPLSSGGARLEDVRRALRQATEILRTNHACQSGMGVPAAGGRRQ
jgi:hypothetical protein